MFLEILKKIHTRNTSLAPFTTTGYLLSQVNNYLYETGLIEMAKKNAGTEYKVSFGDTWFAQSNMTDADLKRADKWMFENEPEIDQFLNESLGAGDKLSLAYDLAHDTLVGSLTIRDPKSPAYGAVITSRSQTAFDCIGLLMFKRWILLDLTTLKDSGQSQQRG